MTKTKNSLLLSTISLLLCVSMLIGTTFAWFTDSVTSSNNKIESGTLKLDLELLENKVGGEWKSIKADETALFNYNKWEPGYTEIKILRVQNEGTLALKWVAQFVAKKELSILANVIDVYVTTEKLEAYPTKREVVEGWTKAGTVAEFVNKIEQTTYGTLLAKDETEGSGDDEAYLGIALKMQETAGNEYQGLDLGGAFDIRIFATQLNSEMDSINKDYDIDAEYAKDGYGMANVKDNKPYYEIDILNSNSPNPNEKIGTATVPKDAIADDVETVGVNMSTSDYNANITVAAGNETLTFDISVDGLKENNDVPVTIRVYVGEGFDPDTFKLYHYDTEIDCTYDPNSGYVIFESATFSPFTIEYDKESVYVAPEVEGTELPKASIIELPEYVNNSNINWYVHDIANSDYTEASCLEAAYKFTALDVEKALEDGYGSWFCDFYVKLDRDLEKDQIFLGGNYGEYGWIGFYNGQVTLPANEEIPLLGSVVTNDWTYEAIAGLVGEFICGVSDVNDALTGAKFTVMLRLTNPEDETEYYNVATIEHIFTPAEKVATTAEDIKTLLAEGKEEIKISGNITLTEGFTHSHDVTFVGVDENAGINFNTHNIQGNGTSEITYKNLTLTTTALPDGNGERTGWQGGIDYCRHAVSNYVDCKISGVFTSYSNILNATGCTFDYYVQDGEEYYGLFQHTTGTVNATDCTFMYGDRAIKIYSHGPSDFVLNLNNCTFTATENFKDNKPLINIDSTYFNSAKITIDKITVDEKLANVSLHNGEGNSKVTVEEIVYSGDELQDAINNGSNATLGGDLDLSQGIVIPGN